MPSQKPYTFAIHTSQRLTKNCKRVCLANAQRNSGMDKAQGTTRNIKNWAESGKFERINNK